MLNRAGNAKRDKQLGRNGIAGLPYLMFVSHPSHIDERARNTHLSAYKLRKFMHQRKLLLLADPPPD